MTAVLIVQSVILVVLCILVTGLLRSYAAVLQRLHRLDPEGVNGGALPAAQPFRTAPGVTPPRDPPPATTDAVVTRAGTQIADRITAGGSSEWGAGHDIAGSGLLGDSIAVRTVGVAHDTVLVFLSSGCSGCGTFWDELADPRQASLAQGARVLVVTRGGEQESVGLLREMASPTTDLVMSTQAWADYAVPGSPYVVVVDGPRGRIKGEGSGTSLQQLSGLVHQALADKAAAIGSAAVSKPRSDMEREVDVDRVLLAAGISPGHASLYPPTDSTADSTDGATPDFARTQPAEQLSANHRPAPRR